MSAKRFLGAVTLLASLSTVNASAGGLAAIDVGLLRRGANTKPLRNKGDTFGDGVAASDEEAVSDASADAVGGADAVSGGGGESDAQAERAIEKAIASAKEISSPTKFLSSRTGNSSTNIREEATHDLSASQSMEAAITELMSGKSAFGATPMGGSVTIIKDLITKQMGPKVIAAHKSDQKLLENLAKEIRKCGKAKTNEFKTAKIQFVKYRKFSSLHKKCRVQEAVRRTSKTNCKSDERLRLKIKKLKCMSFASVSKLLTTTQNNKVIVSKGGGESAEMYVRRLSGTFCGRHVHGRRGNIAKTGGLGGGLEKGILDKYLKAKEGCHKATVAYKAKAKECKRKTHAYKVRKAQCNQYQDEMDGSSCKRAILVKDACESYAGCYHIRVKTYKQTEAKTFFNERDRKSEWRGLKRMECLIHSFADGNVANSEVEACKKKTHSTDHLNIKFPKVPSLAKCTRPDLYPSTGAYRRAEFAPLPFLAKGKESLQCQGVTEIGTTPRKGSPKSCKCERLTLNGQYTPGPLVKCSKCIDVHRSTQRNSCPRGTKLFAPTSPQDWKTFLRSVPPLRDPNFIIDITRPQDGCGGCTSSPMNSGTEKQKSWRTSDGAPWWLRNMNYKEPNGDYVANCYLDLAHGPNSKPRNENSIVFNDNKCNYHSKSYYCQPIKYQLKPKAGSPRSCKCTKVDLAGSYSAGALIKCEQCLSVSKSTQKNSCPTGMKIFSPRSRQDWKTFLKSAKPLRAPHWIIDVTRPQNGCGGCKKYPMNSKNRYQATWRTSDGSPWWLRSTTYSEPNGDYTSNCYLDLWRTPTSENTIQFNDGRCNYRSRSYYCQPIEKKKLKKFGGGSLKLTKNTKVRRLVGWTSLKKGIVEKVFYFTQGTTSPDFSNRSPSLIRRVNKIMYPKTTSKWPGVGRKDHFAVQWDAFLVITKPGLYTFYISSDDGSKLFIDKKKVVEYDGSKGMQTAYGRVKLVSGQHNFLATMFQKTGHSGMRVIYKGPDTNNRNLYVGSGKSARYVPPKGFKEQVYYMKGLKSVPNLDGQNQMIEPPAMVRLSSHVVYAETSQKWPGFTHSDDFAVRWSGLLAITQGGKYRWSLLSDDGSRLFFAERGSDKWVKVVDNDGLHGLRNRESDRRCSGNYKVRVKLEYFDRGGKSCMIFRYMGPDTQNRMKYVPQKVMLADI